MNLQSVLDYVTRNWFSLLLPIGTFFVILLAGWAGRHALFGRLSRWAASTKGQFDDLLIDSLRGPFLLGVVILGISVATHVSRLPPKVTLWSGKILLALWIISLTLVFSRLSGRMVRMYGNRLQGALPMGTLTERLASLLVGLLGTAGPAEHLRYFHHADPHRTRGRRPGGCSRAPGHAVELFRRILCEPGRPGPRRRFCEAGLWTRWFCDRHRMAKHHAAGASQ